MLAYCLNSNISHFWARVKSFKHLLDSADLSIGKSVSQRLLNVVEKDLLIFARVGVD
jgi:hypothetical protein